MTVMMKTARILVPLVLAVAAPGLVQPAAAMAGHVSRPVAVSGRSPFRLGCTGAGRGFAHGAEVEPSLAADPADPADLAAQPAGLLVTARSGKGRFGAVCTRPPAPLGAGSSTL